MSILNFIKKRKRDEFLPDPEKENSKEEAELCEFINDSLELPKTPKREKRGTYNVYSPEIRAKIGKYAVENGVMNASRHFTSELGSPVRESTIRNLKKAYMKSRDRTPCRRVLELPKGDRGRPLMLGKYDELVQNHIRKLRLNGGIVNTWIVMSISRAVLMFHQKSLLSEFGGPITIEKSLAESILRRMGYAKRKGTKSVKVLPSDFENVKADFLQRIKTVVKKHSIPECLIINVDETGVNIVPVGNWTMDLEGNKQVKITGLDDKRQITVTLASTASGVLLDPQVIYEGKTPACHPKFKFPEGWAITQSENHWANSVTTRELVNSIIIPYVKSTRKRLGIKATSKALLLWDVFRGHQDDEARAILKRNNIELVYIPPNCTDQLQPLDQLVNKEFKGALKKEFQKWYADSILDKMSEKSDDESVVSSINLKLSVLKPVHAQWLVRAIDSITARKELLVKSFETTGILNVI